MFDPQGKELSRAWPSPSTTPIRAIGPVSYGVRWGLDPAHQQPCIEQLGLSLADWGYFIRGEGCCQETKKTS